MVENAVNVKGMKKEDNKKFKSFVILIRRFIMKSLDVHLAMPIRRGGRSL